MPPFSIRQIDHVVLRAQDPQRLIAFYRDVLGCRVEHEQPKLGLTHLRAGSALIDIVDYRGALAEAGDAAPARPQRNVDHICLGVDGFEPASAIAHLRRHGIDPGAVQSRFGAEGEGPSLYFFDPEGNMVELKGRPA
ncbi:MAG TPA: VOC family protein [Ferrovibrio sp.]|uniref:VOC family protein n=1 Tax=Ferrovibrio sp. TaxID=1917215 RepID=UPI002ED53EA5